MPENRWWCKRLLKELLTEAWKADPNFVPLDQDYFKPKLTPMTNPDKFSVFTTRSYSLDLLQTIQPSASTPITAVLDTLNLK